MFADAPDEYLEPLTSYGEKVGVAFQLIDDVIDIAEAGASGKTPGTDLRAGVPTLPMLLLRAQAKTDAHAAELVEFIDSGLEDDAKLAEAVKRLREHEVAEQAYQQAKRWADEAVAALAALPDSNVKSALKNFAEAVVDRDN